MGETTINFFEKVLVRVAELSIMSVMQGLLLL